MSLSMIHEAPCEPTKREERKFGFIGIAMPSALHQPPWFCGSGRTGGSVGGNHGIRLEGEGRGDEVKKRE